MSTCFIYFRYGYVHHCSQDFGKVQHAIESQVPSWMDWLLDPFWSSWNRGINKTSAFDFNVSLLRPCDLRYYLTTNVPTPSYLCSMYLSEGQDQREPSDKAEEIIQEDVQRKWQSYLWDSFDKSPEERKFLFKLDFALLTFASLGAHPITFHVRDS